MLKAFKSSYLPHHRENTDSSDTKGYEMTASTVYYGENKLAEVFFLWNSVPEVASGGHALSVLSKCLAIHYNFQKV